jgi:hypothetical protein
VEHRLARESPLMAHRGEPAACLRRRRFPAKPRRCAPFPVRRAPCPGRPRSPMRRWARRVGAPEITRGMGRRPSAEPPGRARRSDRSRRPASGMTPGIGRPPAELPTRAERHGEQAPPVGGQDSARLEVGPHADQAVLVGIVDRWERPRGGVRRAAPA